VEEAERNLAQLQSLQNDVGLFSEEYDPKTNRVLGNFPQAFSHIGLLHAIFAIADASKREPAASGVVPSLRQPTT
jgi:GH15 family glucan-1,4-alpha-glucosidase